MKNQIQIVVLGLIVATTLLSTTVVQSAQASVDNDDNNNCAEKSALAEILCDGQQLVSRYNEGVSDGKQAAADGKSNACPESDDFSGYCIGFGTGWNKVSNAQETLNDVNSNNNDDDNDGNGNREDDGEFVPRVIQQQDVPKRVIGQD